MNPAKTSRLLIYAHYDPQGKLDEHVLYQIRAMKEFCADIILVSNSPLDEADIKKLAPLTKEIILRPDEGYDWAAWKTALMKLGPKGLADYDELVIMNDSTYGPMFPLEEAFTAMESTDVDYWSLTRDISPAYGDHLQPYFCVFRSKLLKSPYFWDFWKTLSFPEDYDSAVENGEIRLTRFLDQAGFINGVYADLAPMFKMPQIGVDYPQVYTVQPWYILKYRLPFVKIKAFRTTPGKLYNAGHDIFTALEEAGSEYPVELIKRHLQRARPLSWSKNVPGFLNVFSKNPPEAPDHKFKIAVFAHLFYPEQFEEALKWLRNIPFAFDLYVSTSSRVKKVVFLEYAARAGLTQAKKIMVRVFEDRGRDVGPWLTGFLDVQQDYDLALKFHLKKHVHFNEVFLYKWQKFILECLLGSPAYVSKVLNLFWERKSLGIAFHPTSPDGLMYMHKNFPGDKGTRECFENTLKRCGIDNYVETSFPIFPQNTFWYRPAALVKLFDSKINITEFPPEPFPLDATLAHGLERAIPYIVQACGYSCALIMPEDQLIAAYQNYEDHILNLEVAGWVPCGNVKMKNPWSTEKGMS